METVRKLLTETDVDVNLVNKLGWTALMETVLLSKDRKKQVEITKMLLSHGADPNIPDKEGVLAIEHARKKGYDDIVEILEAATKN